VALKTKVITPEQFAEGNYVVKTEEVDRLIEKSKHLRLLVNLRYQEQQIKNRIKELLPDALDEFNAIFGDQTVIKGDIVTIEKAMKPGGSLEFKDPEIEKTIQELNAKLDEAKAQVKDLMEEAKKQGKVEIIPTGEYTLRVKLKKK
jgi:DNA-binding transcriptional MerR regulator